MKRLISVLLIVAMMMTMLSACGASQNTTTTTAAGSSDTTGSAAETTAASASSGKTRATTNGKEENSLTLALNTTTSTLDPHHYAMQVEDNVLSQIYEPLFFVADDYSFVNLVASEVVVAEDGSSVTCTLRDGVTFASGDPVTVDDVLYSFSRCENSILASAIYAYSTLEAVDEKTVVFSFPYYELGAGFWDLCPYFRSMFIVNQSYCETVVESVDGDLGYNCDGTGAYMLESIDNVGNITLVKNPTYYGDASIDTLKFVVNTGDLTLAFEAGDIDYVSCTATEYADFETYSNVGTKSQPVNNVGFLGYNCTETSAFNDINVRKAATLCLNREDIGLIASDGGGMTAYNMATPLVSGYADCTNHYDMNIEEANALLTAAGYSASNKVNVVLIVLGAYPEWVAACEIIKENLEQSYFSVTIDELPDQSRYFTFDFDMFMISIGLTASLSSYATIFDDAGLNLSGISGEEQAAVLDSFADLSSAEKLEACQIAMVDSFAYVPVWYQTMFSVFDSNLNVTDYYTVSSAILFSEFSWK